ncbi:uncharacterized protein SRS1_10935 [Sporisorium reilianum f. sp. reilianum]|uniref:Fungal lipase-type domain-containing protein n=1 Tax=Sporisorium reilianum f. sp. reilianum TaxID=72559 RepID=A0A2N8UMX4_9BASI|nr:uncharacterized protein SRS1_10935 [Sporisorium reilianum f. sp. reilianum]
MSSSSTRDAPPDLRDRSGTNSQKLIGPGHGGKHAQLCANLRRRQVADLANVSEKGSGILGWFSATLSDLVYYFFTWMPRTWWVTLTSLPQLVLDPLGFWSALVFASVTTVVLFGSLVVSAIWRLPYVQDIWQPYSHKKDVGLGNLAYPLIFEFGASPRNKQIRDAAFAVMSDPTSTFAQPSTAEERNFDLEVSKLLMMLSALVYERNVGAYYKAAQTVHQHKKKKSKHKKIVAGIDALTESDQREVGQKLAVADAKINQVANEWGLNYASVSELATNTSPLCGAFWHPDHNFIILAFKGTDPVEFKEWAVDFTFDYTDGRGWLPGYTKVHVGFYNQIFPQQLNHATGSFPFTEIRTAVNEIARQIRASSGQDHVNLYVTGHSLGAALACVFYSRAIASPKDFGQREDGTNQVHVRDAYCFGTPIIGDPDCISAFNQSCHDRDLDHPQALWRVTNRRDAVATLLPDAGDNRVLAHISPTSQLHFAHVGQEVQLSNDIYKVYTGPGTLLPTQTPVNIITHLDRGGKGPDVALPPLFSVLEHVPLLRRLVAHMPSSYWDRLTKVQAEVGVEYVHWH